MLLACLLYGAGHDDDVLLYGAGHDDDGLLYGAGHDDPLGEGCVPPVCDNHPGLTTLGHTAQVQVQEGFALKNALKFKTV